MLRQNTRTLEVDAVVPFLIGQGLLDEATVASHDITVRGATGRHQSFRVLVDDDDGYFVKQADGLVHRGREALGAEAAFHQAAARHPPATTVAPDLVAWIPAESVLVTRLLAGYRTLREDVLSRPAHRMPLGYWRQIGEALACCHEWHGPEEAVTTPSVWTTFWPEPAALSTLTLGELAVLRIVRDSQMHRKVEALQGDWEPTAFGHGDVRPENVLVVEHADRREVRLTDWELSGRADPLWDLAGALEMAVTLSLGRGTRRELDLPVVQAAA